MTEHILTSQDAGVLHVRFNRPDKKNAITVEMYEALAAAFRDAQDDPDVRVIQLEGSDEIFTSGNDLAGFLMPFQGAGDPPVFQWIKAAVRSTKPLVAAVSGPAIGIGSTILLHFDLVYADRSAYFHMPFTDLATVPEGGASFILPRRFGPKIAADFLIACDKVTPYRALEIGFINGVVDGDVREHATAISRRLAQKPPSAMRKTKELMRADMDALLTHIDVEGREFAACMASDEMKQVIMAMMAKSTVS